MGLVDDRNNLTVETDACPDCGKRTTCFVERDWLDPSLIQSVECADTACVVFS